MVLLAIAGLGGLATFYTDILWFDQLGYRAMFFKRWTASAITFVAAFGVALLVLLGNWLVAQRRAGPIASGEPGRLARNAARIIIIGGALWLAFLFALIAGSWWDEILLFINGQSFGLVDPIFGQDVSFYLFKLPVYRMAQGWLTMLLSIALVGLLPVYAASSLDEVQRREWRLIRATPLRQHAAILGGLWGIVGGMSHPEEAIWISIAEVAAGCAIAAAVCSFSFGNVRKAMLEQRARKGMPS
ncbi:MAG TPA: UPF0182 family protein [Promineifilum sp.]|nr:UPF0182 family protein [Promineifilum sp.]